MMGVELNIFKGAVKWESTWAFAKKMSIFGGVN